MTETSMVQDVGSLSEEIGSATLRIEGWKL